MNGYQRPNSIYTSLPYCVGDSENRDLAAPKSKLEQAVGEFLALSEEEKLDIARDIVKKLVEAKRKKAAR